jgi:protein-disulfide isomerase
MSDMSDDVQDLQGGDVIVLRKWVVFAAGLAVLGFLAGGVVGYLLAMSASRLGAQQAANQVATQVAEVAEQVDQIAAQLPNQVADQVAQQVAVQPQPAVPQPQPTAAPSRIDDVKTDGDPQLGPDDAKVTIVEFSDFQCPYCKRFRDTTFDALIEKYGDNIRIVYRDYPLPFHPQAQIAAEAAECANEQDKYWEMHDVIYANQETLSDDVYSGFAEQLGLDIQKFDECLSNNKYADEIAADQKDGEAYGVSGTPTFFINGWILVGAQPTSEFEKLIDQEMSN